MLTSFLRGNQKDKDQVTAITLDVSSMIFYFIALNALIFIILSFTGVSLINKFLVLILASTYYLLSLAFKKLPVKVEIKAEGTVRVKFIRFFKPWIESYRIEELKCSFEKETRARGLKAHVFRMENKAGIIMEAIPNQSGWSERKLKMILNSLSKGKG